MNTALTFAVVALGRRDPGVAHYLEWGSVLFLTIAFVVIWSIRTWKNAPDPDERWHRAEEEDRSTRSSAGVPPVDPAE
ncbi:MAG: hypothetical protein M3O88_05365 [Actinomycetota bacterium]|nr:hypothetical protein [Actinomycetota bacterium]